MSKLATPCADYKDLESARKAVEELAQSGDTQAFDGLAYALTNHPNAHVRSAIARALMTKPDDRSTAMLAAALRSDTNHEVRKAIAFSLLKLHWSPTSSADRAIFAVARKDWTTVRALRHESVAPLAVAYSSNEPVEKQEAGALLIEIADSATPLEVPLAFIGFGLYSDTAEKKHIAAKARDLVKLAGETAVPRLVQILNNDSSEKQRISAAELLGEMCAEVAVGPLLATLRESNYDLVNRSAQALGRLKATEAIEPIIFMLATARNRNDMDTSLAALADITDNEQMRMWKPAFEHHHIDPDIRAALLSTLQASNDRIMRATSAALIGCKQDSRFVTPLTAALSDIDSLVRKCAAVAVLHSVQSWERSRFNDIIMHLVRKELPRNNEFPLHSERMKSFWESAGPDVEVP